jgi:CSLREA domain-containing protein
MLVTVLLVISPLLRVPVVRAASLTVKTLSDADDDTDGVCSLREAITAANTNTSYNECSGSGTFGDDTISFTVSGTIRLNSTLPPIEGGFGRLTINGAGNITISGDTDNDGSGNVRVFIVGPGANLTLNRLTVTKGNSGSNNDGGGLFNSSGTVMITSSIFSNNVALAGGDGGGLFNDIGTVIIMSSTFSGNSAGGSPGYGRGGGLYNNGGLVTISDSTFSGNSAIGTIAPPADGGGLYNVNNGTINLSNSTISNNSAHNGGGLSNIGATAMITNSTFSGNGTTGVPAGFGGGLQNVTGTVTITSSTFSGNSSTGSLGFSGGGGIGNSGTVKIKNSIVADNSGGNCALSAVTSSGINLATDGSCSGFLQVPSTGAGGLNLRPLANNGGPTQTHALASGSVAIDAVTDCTDLQLPPQPVNSDQLGVPRPQGDACDVGAYEMPVMTLTVAGAGTGSGSVIGMMGMTEEIHCSISAGMTSGDCTRSAFEGENPVMTLAATPDMNSTFVGWSGHPDCSDGVVTINNDKVCTARFDLPPGTLIITKTALGGNGTFSFSGPNGGSFSITTSGGTGSQAFTLAPGSYLVSENALPSGWTFATLVCNDPTNNTTVTLNQRKATIHLAASETVTCTFTNRKLGGNLFIVQGNGYCLQLDLTAHTYKLTTATRIVSGPLAYSYYGSLLRFRSGYGDSHRLQGTINLQTRSATGTLMLSRGLGGTRINLNDPNVDDNGPCP